MDEAHIRNRFFFYVVFLVLIILTILLLEPFFDVIVLSIITVIILKPLYTRYLKVDRIKDRQRLASSLALATFLLLLIVPASLILYLTISQLAELLEAASDNLGAVIEDFSSTLPQLVPLGGNRTGEGQFIEDLQALAGAASAALANTLVNLVSSLPNLIMQGIIFLVLVVTLMPEYDNLVRRFQAMSPLGTELSELYYRKTTAMVTSLVKGVFLIAVLQGAAMGFFFWLAGIPFAFLLSLLSMVLAMLPVVGISYLVLFVAFLLAISGQFLQAGIVLFGFYGVVNWIDIILRPRLISKEAYLNFALVLLGILAGLLWAGILGLFYGPVILLLLVTTINIYSEYYAQEDGTALRLLIVDRRGGSKDQPAEAAE
jgi:predicted PurR-regulated permease PerM